MVTDIALDGIKPILNNDIELILQQIDLLFDTYKREVIGYEEFGTQYDDYLYDLQLSGASLEREVMADLNSLDLHGFAPKVQVHLLQGTEQDIAIISITLTRYDEQYKKIYKVTQ